MSVKTWPAALLCGIVLAMSAAAQEEPAPKEPPPAEPPAATPQPAPKAEPSFEPPAHRWGGWTISVAAWDPTLVGADETISTVDHGGTAVPLVLDSDARIKETVRVTYHLPNNLGSVLAQYDAMGHEDELQQFTPGDFAFAETRAYPLSLGVFDDGMSDGVAARASRRTHEFRLEFQKTAFESKWAKATWGVGYRDLSHSRQLGITYYAIVANLPPIIPPVGTAADADRLAPRPDGVTQDAQFSGHGLGASFDVEFPVHRRVSIISGLSIGLIRGKADSTNVTTASAYFLGTSTVPMTAEELFAFLSSPPIDSDPDDGVPPPTVADIHQDTVVTGLASKSNSLMAQSFDIYLGVQVSIWKGLKVFATARDVSYTNVGQYVVPRPGPSTETTSLDTGYEGYNIGLSWRF